MCFAHELIISLGSNNRSIIVKQLRLVTVGGVKLYLSLLRPQLFRPQLLQVLESAIKLRKATLSLPK